GISADTFGSSGQAHLVISTAGRNPVAAASEISPCGRNDKQGEVERVGTLLPAHSLTGSVPQGQISAPTVGAASAAIAEATDVRPPPFAAEAAPTEKLASGLAIDQAFACQRSAGVFRIPGDLRTGQACHFDRREKSGCSRVGKISPRGRNDKQGRVGTVRGGAGDRA